MSSDGAVIGLFPARFDRHHEIVFSNLYAKQKGDKWHDAHGDGDAAEEPVSTGWRVKPGGSVHEGAVSASDEASVSRSRSRHHIVRVSIIHVTRGLCSHV